MGAQFVHPLEIVEVAGFIDERGHPCPGRQWAKLVGDGVTDHGEMDAKGLVGVRLE